MAEKTKKKTVTEPEVETKVEPEVEAEAETTVEDEKKNDMVTIMVPYVPGEGKEQTVILNGKVYQIKKACFVEVPIGVAEILQTSSQAIMAAEESQEKMKVQAQALN